MLTLLCTPLRDLLRPRRDLLLENLALRQQINVLPRDSQPRSGGEFDIQDLGGSGAEGVVALGVWGGWGSE